MIETLLVRLYQQYDEHLTVAEITSIHTRTYRASMMARSRHAMAGLRADSSGRYAAGELERHHTEILAAMDTLRAAVADLAVIAPPPPEPDPQSGPVSTPAPAPSPRIPALGAEILPAN